jgi:hypothetical protein
METKQQIKGEEIKTRLKFVNKLRNPLLKNQTKNTKLKMEKIEKVKLDWN